MISRGATLREAWLWPADTAGTPVDLTGWEAWGAIGTVPWEAPLVALASTSGSITLGGDTGIITVVVAATVTADLPTGHGRWDLLLRPVGGETTHLLTGVVTFIEPLAAS